MADFLWSTSTVTVSQYSMQVAAVLHFATLSDNGGAYQSLASSTLQ